MRPIRKSVIVAALAAAVLVAPLAVAAGEGDPIIGGERNPGGDQTRELRDETQIIARSESYGTRQSNKGDGGGAIYGCRASRRAAEDEIACLRANNLRDGRAFSFETDGPIAGEIEVGHPSAEPFATNGRGKVENLNADMVDSTDLAPILARLTPGQTTPRPLARVGSLSLSMRCDASGDVSVVARTDDNGIVHSLAHGIGAEVEDAEAKDESFRGGETFDTGFDDSHSGFVRYFDDDEAVTVALSTEEQPTSPPTCVAFGSASGGPHAVAASVAPAP